MTDLRDQYGEAYEDSAYAPLISPWVLLGWSVVGLAIWTIISAIIVAVLRGRIP